MLRALLLVAGVLLTLGPAALLAPKIATAVRNVPYWDEVDTAVALVLRLDDGAGWQEVLSQLFAVANEHRMVTSRLLFAGSYWLTGTVNFAVVSLIGNLSLICFLAVLLAAAGSGWRRLQLGVILGLLFGQWQHYENFLWAGSSIDHFQVVLLAGGALVALARPSRSRLALAFLGALLATFTLAHGLLTWPLGALLLWRQSRKRELWAWGSVAVLVIGGYLVGFHLNQSQSFADLSLKGLLTIVRYWLKLLGSVPSVGQAAVTPWLGALLVGVFCWLVRRGADRRDPALFACLTFAIGALAMVAVGRAAESGGEVFSRYYVLGALAWSLALFLALQEIPGFQRSPVPFACVASLLLAFNVSATHTFAPMADSWTECRDRAALRFKQHGVDGRGPFKLHPIPSHATALLSEAECRGIYRVPPICLERSFPGAVPSSRIVYRIDEMEVNPRAASLSGWVSIRGLPVHRGDIHVVLRSADRMHVFETISITRPDVATVLGDPSARLAGFRFARRRENLPSGEFEVGFLFRHRGWAEYVMTDNRVRLTGEGEVFRATGDEE